MTPDERDTQAGALGLFIGSLRTQHPPKVKGYRGSEDATKGLIVTLEVGRDGVFYEIELQMLSAKRLTTTG